MLKLQCTSVLIKLIYCGAIQVITGLGTSEDELDADLQERLADAEHQQYTDDAINAVLLLAAQAEMAQLRASSAPQQASDQVCLTALLLGVLQDLYERSGYVSAVKKSL